MSLNLPRFSSARALLASPPLPEPKTISFGIAGLDDLSGSMRSGTIAAFKDADNNPKTAESQRVLACQCAHQWVKEHGAIVLFLCAGRYPADYAAIMKKREITDEEAERVIFVDGAEPESTLEGSIALLSDLASKAGVLGVMVLDDLRHTRAACTRDMSFDDFSLRESAQLDVICDAKSMGMTFIILCRSNGAGHE